MEQRNFWQYYKEKGGLLTKIQELDKAETSGCLSKQLRLDKAKAKDEFQEIVIREEIKWRQKSRINWLRKGDNNTKFFHSFANIHKFTNRISSLIIKGSECEDAERTANEIIEYYKRLCRKNRRTEAWFSRWTGKKLSQEQAAR